jgi:hypothetical protein
MSDTHVVIGFALYNATKAALDKFRRFLPAGALSDVTEKADIEEWAKALIGVSLDAILDAASRWLRDEELLDAKGRTTIPNIASFARYARRVDFEHWRPPLVMVAQQPASIGTMSQRETLQRRAQASLGSRELAQEVWGVLWKEATTDQQRQAVREGRVPLAEFDIAIELVRESARLARRVPA